jgi:hypothetical protein
LERISPRENRIGRGTQQKYAIQDDNLSQHAGQDL